MILFMVGKTIAKLSDSIELNKLDYKLKREKKYNVTKISLPTNFKRYIQNHFMTRKCWE